uniref:Serpin domain-containing protein n=1 Tax=Timema cristinae TaxID=61476 RepID=A0A7R9CJC9_TIMCR|nr:unnamed protein product [Timema cristinae]
MTTSVIYWSEFLAKYPEEITVSIPGISRFFREAEGLERCQTILMGVSELFSNGDLSGISGKNITLDEFWQHSGIQISEGSTEAISANALSYHAGFGYSHAKPEAVVEFRADHPFIFIIRENSGPVLFIGRYIGPNDDSPSSSESVEHEKVDKKESMTLVYSYVILPSGFSQWSLRLGYASPNPEHGSRFCHSRQS